MRSRIQTGATGRVPAPAEKRFPITLGGFYEKVHSTWYGIVSALLLSALFACAQLPGDDNSVSYKSLTTQEVADVRDHQHGIDVVKNSSGSMYVIWSSSGNPPAGPNSNGDWTHDIYYSKITASSPSISAVKWLSASEAQEPASTAINSAGRICTIWEDGYNVNNEVAQRYITSALPPAGTYSGNKTILDGGHSGHVGAVGANFVVHWSKGWVSGGGVDNLGSGKGCYVNVVSSTGSLGSKYTVARGRCWWPEVDGSASKACLIWQKYVSGQKYAKLRMRMFDPSSKKFTTAKTLMSTGLLYYHYSVRYIKSIDRFLVLASVDGGAGSNSGRKCSGGKAFLIDNSGNTVATATLANGVIRESTQVVNGSRVAFTYLGNGKSVFGGNSTGGAVGGLMVLNLTASSITVSKTVSSTYAWQYIGNDGYWKDSSSVVIFALSTSGIQIKTFTGL